MATPPTGWAAHPHRSHTTPFSSTPSASHPSSLATSRPRPLSVPSSLPLLSPQPRPLASPAQAQSIPAHSLYPRPRMSQREPSRASNAARIRSVSYGTSGVEQRQDASYSSSPSRVADYSDDAALATGAWGVLGGGGGSLRRTSAYWYGGIGGGLASPVGRRRVFPSAMDDDSLDESAFSKLSGGESIRGAKPGVVSSEEDNEDAEEEAEVGTARYSEGDRGSVRELLLSTTVELEAGERRSRWTLSTLQRNVLKCVLAFYLSELFTFVPVLSDFVAAPFGEGTIKNAHIIATVALYFNPAKTIGAMIESDLFFLFGVLYTVFICCGSMAMTVILRSYGYAMLARALVLVFWLGGGFGLVAYMKFRVNKPTMSVACSLVFVISSVIITKEGALHTSFDFRSIAQIVCITLLGTSISNVVCIVLWPTSATEILRGDLNRTMDSFSTLLGLLVDTFLLTDETTPHSPAELAAAIKSHQSCFTTLKSTLSQSSYEFSSTTTSATHRSYDDAVGSMTKLAQGLTGMRSGCSMQSELIRAVEGGGEEESVKQREEMEVLELFRDKVGQSLHALTSTSRNVLLHLGTASTKPTSHPHTMTPSTVLSSLKLDLLRTLTLFKKSHSAALAELYQQLPARSTSGTHDGRFAEGDEKDTGDDGPNDTLFRIYYFCFNLEEWVKELSSLVDTFTAMRENQEELDFANSVHKASWGIFSPLIRWFGLGMRLKVRAVHSRSWSSSIKTRIALLFSDAQAADSENPFPEIVDGAVTSHSDPSSNLSMLGRLKHKFWYLGWHLRQPRLKFAVKTGAGVALLASPAFLSGLRPYWLQWRGEWALVSYMVIMAPTLGGTNFLAVGRIIMTLVGAGAGVVSFLLFSHNEILLPIIGAVLSIFPFYIIITQPDYGPSARFLILTWNLTCLYASNLRELGTDTHVVSIAIHRSAAVVAGVIWGLIVTSYIWPFEARRELRKGLSEYLQNLAYLYERLVRTYSKPPSKHSKVLRAHPATEVDERAPLLPRSEAQRYEVDDFIEMEVYLQLSLIKLSDLLAATKLEPRLKGPFPVAPYRNVLASCQNLLDLLTSMRTVTNRDAWYTTVRRDFVLPVNAERREMVGNVLLYFSLLASAMSLKTPMPAYLPPAAHARERLVQKLRTLPVVKRRIVRGGSEGLLYLAYALTMKDVIAQLEILGSTFQQLFGIIGGGREEFEALFEDDEHLTEDDFDPSLGSGITQRGTGRESSTCYR